MQLFVCKIGEIWTVQQVDASKDNFHLDGITNLRDYKGIPIP